MTRDEVVDGIIMRPELTNLTYRTQSQDNDETLLDICAPFLEIVDGKLKMVHSSANDYLLDPRSGPFIDVVQAHLHIASSCIKAVEAFVSDFVSENGCDDQPPKTFGHLHYACKHWNEHAMIYFQKMKQQERQDQQLLAALSTFQQVLIVANAKLQSPVLPDYRGPPRTQVQDWQRQIDELNKSEGPIPSKNKTH